MREKKIFFLAKIFFYFFMWKKIFSCEKFSKKKNRKKFQKKNKNLKKKRCQKWFLHTQFFILHMNWGQKKFSKKKNFQKKKKPKNFFMPKTISSYAVFYSPHEFMSFFFFNFFQFFFSIFFFQFFMSPKKFHAKNQKNLTNQYQKLSPNKKPNHQTPSNFQNKPNYQYLISKFSISNPHKPSKI